MSPIRNEPGTATSAGAMAGPASPGIADRHAAVGPIGNDAGATPGSTPANIADRHAIVDMIENDTGAAPILACVVNWNTPALTLRCLDALQRSRPRPVRVLVVDNASGDDSVARIAESHPQVECLVLPDNVGFAGAVAQAATRLGTERALLVLNSDAEPEPDALAQLLHAWQVLGDGVFGAAPLRRDRDGGLRLLFPSKFLGRGPRWSVWRRDRRLDYERDWREAAPCRVLAVAGSAMLLPRALLARHGGMDPDWFLYCEETDYCLRLAAAGMPSWLVPQARVAHRGGGSHARRRGVAAVIDYYRTRNEIQLARRHLGRGAALAVALRKALRALVRSPWPASAGALWRGVFDGLRGRRGKTLAPEARLDDELDAALAAAWRHRIASALRARLRRPQPPQVIHITAQRRLRLPPAPPWLAAWQAYLAGALERALRNSDAPLDVVLQGAPPPPAPVRVLEIGLQWEHTLVRPGGRDAQGAQPGTVPLPEGGGHYLVRLARESELRGCGLVIDYSRANLENLRLGNRHAEHLARSVAIAPAVFAPRFESPRRDLPLVSLMHDLHQTRRGRFVTAARCAGLPLRNVRGVYAPELLQRLFLRTRVLVNLHQTDHHHTFEELRVLPALLCGVVVVSEEVPLREHIPYADAIVWCAYDALVDTVRAVLRDYEAHRARVFGDGSLADRLSALRRENQAALEDALRTWDLMHPASTTVRADLR